MPTKAQGFLCPKCRQATLALVVQDPLNQERGGHCHLRGLPCRHIVLLKCDQCNTEHAVESAWNRRW